MGSVFGQDYWLEDNENDTAAEILARAFLTLTGRKGLKMYSICALETVVDHQPFGKDETGLSGNNTRTIRLLSVY